MSGFKRKLQDSLLFPRILHLLAARQESGRKWSFLRRKAEKVAPGLEKVEARLKKEKEQLPVEPPWLRVR